MQESDDSFFDGFSLPDGSVVKAVRHRNPDGSLGGWVPEGLEIPDDVFIGPGVIIYPGIQISENAQILGPCVLAPAA